MADNQPAEQGATRRPNSAEKAAAQANALAAQARGSPLSERLIRHYENEVINRGIEAAVIGGALLLSTKGNRGWYKPVPTSRGPKFGFLATGTADDLFSQFIARYNRLPTPTPGSRIPIRFPVPVGLPGDPIPIHPDYAKLSETGWDVDANWPPPIGSPYGYVHDYRKNITTEISLHPDPSVQGGTVLPLGDWSGVGVGDLVTTTVGVDNYTPPFGSEGSYYATQGHAIRLSGSTDPWTFEPATEVKVYPPTWFDNPLDPNIARGLPSAEPFAEPALEQALEPIVSRALEVSPEGVFDVPLSPRAPPKRRVRERKFLSRSGKLIVGLFRALDTISESAEVVDALYEAIPKEVRRAEEKKLGFHWAKSRDGKWRWMKPRGLARGLLDTAGQYGIDGADWKSAIIAKHFNEIDVEDAFKNIINNEIQDKVIGGLQRNIPKNTGQAVGPAMQAVNKLLGQYVSL